MKRGQKPKHCAYCGSRSQGSTCAQHRDLAKIEAEVVPLLWAALWAALARRTDTATSGGADVNGCMARRTAHGAALPRVRGVHCGLHHYRTSFVGDSAVEGVDGGDDRVAEVKKPKCESCGTSANVHAVSRPGMIPGAALSHAWLCGDYEYLIEHGTAARIAPPTRVNRLQPQVESLLSGEGTAA